MHSSATDIAIATAVTYCDRVTLVTYYNQVLPLLTDRRVYEQKLRGYRYFVDVISHDWVEQDGYLVPKHSQTLDVVVTEPTEAAIKLLVASCGWLNGYTVVSYSQPESGEAPF